jgi:hypothetical protein
MATLVDFMTKDVHGCIQTIKCFCEYTERFLVMGETWVKTAKNGSTVF